MPEPTVTVSATTIRAAISRLSLMKFFPADEDFRAALIEFFMQVCSTDEQVEKLSRKTIAVYGEWPGIHEFRACACSIFKPKDGVNADSSVFVEGIPSFAELANPDLAAIPPAVRRLDLPPAEQVTAYKQLEAAKSDYIEDPELSELVRSTAEQLRMEQRPKQPRTAEELHNELYRRKQVKVDSK